METSDADMLRDILIDCWCPCSHNRELSLVYIQVNNVTADELAVLGFPGTVTNKSWCIL